MIILVLITIGLALGSFVNALVWRIYEQNNVTKVKSSLKRTQYLKSLSILGGRSMCTHCHRQLVVKDLVPLFSWLTLKGHCRYCKKAIGWQYPAVELITASLFIISYINWPLPLHGLGLLEFISWLLFIVGFMALAVYDIRWYLLPNRIVFPLFILSIFQILIELLFYHQGKSLLIGSLGGVLIGGGIFYILFQLSKGNWIGGGDVKLGALLGLLLGSPLASLLLLFLASLIGSLVSIPLLLGGRLKRTKHIPFGPFLIVAAIIVRLFGAYIINWLKTRYIIT